MTIEGGTLRYLASAAPRPRAPESHWLSNMDAILLPNGYNLSIPTGNFHVCPLGNTTGCMQTIAETRRARLEDLIARYGNSVANLNEALGYERNDTRLARIRNANARTDRPGKVFQMGDPQAREIEAKLGLERGWMDTPAAFEYSGEGQQMQMLHRIAQDLQPYQIEQLITIGATLAHGPAAAASNKTLKPESADEQAQNPAAVSAPRAGPVAVKAVVAKKIGGGHFGPPAEAPDGVKKNGSSRARGVPRKRHADGGR